MFSISVSNFIGEIHSIVARRGGVFSQMHFPHCSVPSESHSVETRRDETAKLWRYVRSWGIQSVEEFERYRRRQRDHASCLSEFFSNFLNHCFDDGVIILLFIVINWWWTRLRFRTRKKSIFPHCTDQSKSVLHFLSKQVLLQHCVSN
jgi:hypothetical protein